MFIIVSNCSAVVGNVWCLNSLHETWVILNVVSKFSANTLQNKGFVGFPNQARLIQVPALVGLVVSCRYTGVYA